MYDKADRACAALDKCTKMLDQLIGPAGCPWDKEQTVNTLCDYALEEMYELIHAVRHGSIAEQREEMGDVLFIMLFMAGLQDKDGNFTLAEVLEENWGKMTGRHPHIFGNAKIDTREALFQSWEKIKKAEKARKESCGGVFGNLPVGLEPLTKAYRINSKSARNNFTWDTDEDAEQQVEAEWLEWLDACADKENREAQEHELGDLIFTIVELGRRKGLKASAALERANQRFLTRFAAMETLAQKRGLDFERLDQKEKDALWAEIKEKETSSDEK